MGTAGVVVGRACEDLRVGEERVVVALTAPLDLRATLGPLGHGPFDPAFRVLPDGAVWRATRTPSGAATLRFVARYDGGSSAWWPHAVEVTAWGPGAVEALAAAPGLLGLHDDAEAFDPPPGVVRNARRRTVGLRLCRSGRVLESLVPAVLEQRVVTRSAWAAWAWLLRRHGEPAPGPGSGSGSGSGAAGAGAGSGGVPEGMRVPPSGERWADVPVWDFHRAGVDPSRARTVVAAARVADRLEEAVALGPDAALRRLRAVPGVGAWTAAHVAQRAWGDPDAVAVGDFHVPGQVGHALAGRAVDDAGMLELLEPYRGHRQRAVRHLLAAGVARAPRRGPRLAVADFRRL